MEVITITTDAWYNPRTKIGTYAYRIRWDNLLLKWNWIFKQLQINWSTCAERWAIRVALYILNQNAQDFDLLIINRDNINANKKDFNKEMVVLLWTINKKYWSKKRKIDLRYIKSHSWTKEKRTYVHNWCDEACKLAYKDFIK